jgi:hypothetical protein
MPFAAGYKGQLSGGNNQTFLLFLSLNNYRNMRFTIALSALVTFVLTTPVNAAGPTPLDVFVPPITSPTAGTVWVSKTQQNVTWCVTAPVKDYAIRSLVR